MAIMKTFGKNPAGERLKKLQQSANYKKKGFENISPTQVAGENTSLLKMTWKFLNKPANTKPPSVLPSVKTDLRNIKEEEPVIVWFGHSSYFIRIAGKNILIDPVFSGYASPFSFSVKSFAGANVYTTDDMPAIDVLILTHDHYDHIDYTTIKKLRPKIKSICTSLGIASHLTYWGFDENKIIEFDWWDSQPIADGIQLTAAPARHFSGRSLKRGMTLWASYILEAAGYKIYIGSDSGYDSHFKMIGDQFGPFDIAILETGQYNADWPMIHMMPEESVQACIDLKAKYLLPVHWAKFALAFHPWQEPVERVLAKAKELQVNVTTPMIGEPVVLNVSYPKAEWWLKV